MHYFTYVNENRFSSYRTQISEPQVVPKVYALLMLGRRFLLSWNSIYGIRNPSRLWMARIRHAPSADCDES